MHLGEMCLARTVPFGRAEPTSMIVERSGFSAHPDGKVYGLHMHLSYAGHVRIEPTVMRCELDLCRDHSPDVVATEHTNTPSLFYVS